MARDVAVPLLSRAELYPRQAHWKGTAVPSNKVAVPSTSKSEAALDYAEMGWPVIPGAIWHDGHFVDPVDERQVVNPLLLRVERATTDVEEVRALWSVPGLRLPNVLTVTGSSLGAFTVFESLAEAIARHPAFAVRRTPVLAIQGMPLPPSASGETAVMWLVTPHEADDTVMAGDDLADIIHSLESA